MFGTTTMETRWHAAWAVLLICAASFAPAIARISHAASGNDFTNTIGQVFVRIPAGTFVMGARGNQCRVTLTRDFFMMKTEVTQGQWRSIMKNNPARFPLCGEDCPVERVSWDDCQEFIRRLNLSEKTDQYRLPTEAEWEYAARAGSTGLFCFGDNESLLGEYAWYSANSGNTTHPVGLKRANAWGLHDMHGNVNEWCADCWYGRLPPGPVTDPRGPSTGTGRVVKGGSWFFHTTFFHLGRRAPFTPDHQGQSLGFRIVREIRP